MWVNAWAYMRMDKQQRWWNFEWNFNDTVQNQINLPEKVIIKDDTLREGEETPGTYFTIDQKIETYRKWQEYYKLQRYHITLSFLRRFLPLFL